MKATYAVFYIFSILEFFNCQSVNDLDVDGIRKTLEKNIPELEHFNKTQLPNAEDVEKIFREKCEKNGAGDAVDSLKDQQEDIRLCIENHVNFTIIQEELEAAKKTGSMDEVFGKYCRKWPSIYSCVQNATITLRSCMDDKERKAFNKSLEIVEELQEFMCFKDGDRLAMFVAEGGVECVQERKDGVQDCLNATLGNRIPDPDNLSVGNLPTFLFSSRDCEDFDKIRICVNEELEQCKDSTPANIVDAFFKFLKKHMPCGVGDNDNGKVLAVEKPSGSWLITANALIVFSALLSMFLY